MTFQARYPGRCPLCEDRIHEGEPVTYVNDELVHVACESERDEDDPSRACAECRLVHRGECF